MGAGVGWRGVVSVFSLLAAGTALAHAEAPVDPPATDAPADAPPAPADAAPADAAPADDGIDLSMLGLDPAAPAFDSGLHVYGFADFNWLRLSSTSPRIPHIRTFGVGNVNLYIRKDLTPRWRWLAEVRLLLTPNGSVAPDGSLIDTASTDTANGDRPVSWGGISIERVYLEYDVAPWLTVRAGHWLTPYGIWNIDHGSPTIIGAARPYIVGESLFPEHQTGLAAFGEVRVGDYLFDYTATLSNGRNPYEATRDPDLRPAVGARLAVEAPWAGTLRVGVSGYAGRASEATGGRYDELALGVDAAWDHGGLRIQAELLTQERDYLAAHPGTLLDGRPAPDDRGWGAYALVGYRFERWWNVMPYGMVERYAPFDPGLLGAHALGLTAGLNFRVAAPVVLKVEYSHGDFGGAGGLYTGTNLDLVRLQAAWVF